DGQPSGSFATDVWRWRYRRVFAEEAGGEHRGDRGAGRRAAHRSRSGIGAASGQILVELRSGESVDFAERRWIASTAENHGRQNQAAIRGFGNGLVGIYVARPIRAHGA